MRTMLGVAAATALPSEVWPFRKIFLPAQPKIVSFRDVSFYDLRQYSAPLSRLLCGAYPALMDVIKEPANEDFLVKIIGVNS